MSYDINMMKTKDNVMSQLIVFSNGGYVIHKMRGVAGSKCKFSVWYNDLGYPVDIERFDSRGRSYKATDKQWEYLMRYVPAGVKRGST
jgi:hypothetical protein